MTKNKNLLTPLMQAIQNNNQVFALTKQTFAQIPFFKDIESSTINKLLTSVELRKVNANTVVFKENAIANEMFIIASGNVEVSRNNMILTTLKEGDFFGEMALISDAPRNATLTTLSDCLFIVLNKKRFLELVSTDPEIALRVSKTVVQRSN